MGSDHTPDLAERDALRQQAEAEVRSWGLMLEEFGDVVAERDALAARVEQLEAAIRERHTAEQQEAEVWWGDADHDERFPECPSGDDCEGHVCTITVCSECGYTHDGETPIFRQWPCPTVAALEAVPVPEPRPAMDDDPVFELRPKGEVVTYSLHRDEPPAERPRCPTCGSNDRGDLYGNENGSRCPNPFHSPSSSPEETR